MNEKQQIAETERRFENWWKTDGAEYLNRINGNLSRHAGESHKYLLRHAWIKSASLARENK